MPVSKLWESQLTEHPGTSLDVVTRSHSKVISGQWLVVGLLMLGIASTALMFVYWDQHTRPFRSLREAIGREFRHSRPNVEGGRQKGRGPNILRIAISVEFPPAEDSPRANQIVDRIREITRDYPDVNKYEKIEVNLIQFVPQELAKTRTFNWNPNEIKTDEQAIESP